MATMVAVTTMTGPQDFPLQRLGISGPQSVEAGGKFLRTEKKRNKKSRSSALYTDLFPLSGEGPNTQGRNISRRGSAHSPAVLTLYLNLLQKPDSEATMDSKYPASL